MTDDQPAGFSARLQQITAAALDLDTSTRAAFVQQQAKDDENLRRQAESLLVLFSHIEGMERSMSPEFHHGHPLEFWQRLKEIVDAALELDAHARSAHIREQAGGNDELRRRAERIVARAPGVASPDHPTSPALAEVLARSTGRSDGPDRPWVGSRVGSFLLTEELSRSAMGAVYLAERIEGGFEQLVAIKLLPRGFQGTAGGRFEHEKQLLARMEHPHIARLIGGGWTDDHHPYLVMELVQGSHVDVHCRNHDLSLRERLRLFLKVCEGVAAAHRQLVIHRDIKPSNIMVTADGTPKLLDFGIAKLLEPGLGPSEATSQGFYAFTTNYASPEQLEGRAATTATDIYSLGVVLYELLTDRLPRRFEAKSPLEMALELRRQQPRRPSTVVFTRDAEHGSGEPVPASPGPAAPRTREQRRRSRILRGDLDRICLKALEVDPDLRYSTVDRLAEDIRLYLAGRPVQAAGPGLLYRTRKFVLRNRLAVAVAALATVASLWALHQATEARAANQRTLEATHLSETLEGFLSDSFGSSDPNRAGDHEPTASELLRRGLEIVTQLDGYPLTKAALLMVIGRTMTNLGHYAEAHPVLMEALRIRREELGRYSLPVANSLYYLAEHWKDQPCESCGERAAKLLRLVLDIYKMHPEADSDDIYLTFATSQAAVLVKKGEDEEAVEVLSEALASPRAARAKPETVAQARADLGGAQVNRGAFAEAETNLRRALGVQLEHQGDKNPKVLSTMNSLAGAMEGLGELEDAGILRRRVLDVRREVEGDRIARIATALSNLAFNLYLQGRHDEAAALLGEERELLSGRRSLDVHRAVLDENEALLAEAEGRWSACIEAAHRSAAIAEPWRHGWALSTIGACAAQLGDENARSRLEAGYREVIQDKCTSCFFARKARQRLIDYWERAGQPAQAEKYREEERQAEAELQAQRERSAALAAPP